MSVLAGLSIDGPVRLKNVVAAADHPCRA